MLQGQRSERVMKRRVADLMKGLMMVMRALMYQVG